MLGIEPLSTDINAFGEAIFYRSYCLRNRTMYLDPLTDPEMHAVKCHIDSLYPTIGMFDCKDPMDTFGLLATIHDAFDDQLMQEALSSSALEFFLAEMAQTSYHDVVHSSTEDHLRAPQ